MATINVDEVTREDLKTYCKKQGITRKKRGHYQARLTENDKCQDKICLMMVLIDNFKKMLVDVKDEVN